MRAIGLVALVAFSGVASAEQCPSAFEEFIGVFERSAEFQVAHSKYPVTYQYMDTDANGEPKRVQVAVTRENLGEYAAVQFPSSVQRTQEAVQQSIAAPDAQTRVVRLWIDDSDFEIKFVFKKAPTCWELTGVEDGLF